MNLAWKDLDVDVDLERWKKEKKAFQTRTAPKGQRHH